MSRPKKNDQLIFELVEHFKTLGVTPDFNKEEQCYHIKLSSLCTFKLTPSFSHLYISANIPNSEKILSDLNAWKKFSRVMKENIHKETIYLALDNKSNTLALAMTIDLVSIWQREDIDDLIVGFIEFFHWTIEFLQDWED
ncbi:MAG: hypothetical protein V4629_07255 [Pseudomonadota bacterium]